MGSQVSAENHNPKNDIVPQNPQSSHLSFSKPQSLNTQTTTFSLSDRSSAVIHSQSNPNQLQMSAPEGKEVPGAGKLVEDGVLRETLDEEIHQVIYKEALNEAVMNLALGDEESRGFDPNRAVEENWDRGGSGNVEGIQGQNGNYEYMSAGEEEGEGQDNNYGIEDRNYRRRYQYPLRIDAEDCTYYMKTGNCKFGMNCKFNHPPRRRSPSSGDKAKPRVEDPERVGQTECKYYLTSGGCKFGNACKYNHSKEKSAVAPILEFNFLGLPIRLGEKECPYYMRTGSCKYGSNCRFNHPDPTSVSGNDPSSGYGNGGSVPLHGAAQSTGSSWSSASMMFPPTQGMTSNPEWNGYQAVYPTSEKSLPTPPAFAMNNLATETNFYAPYQQQMPVDEFPCRPDQPVCSYFLKTGDCKYKANCRFHHPKVQSSKSTSCALSDKGLPLRPDQAICSFYNRYGICKFGPACKFDHPENWGKSVASDGVAMARNEMEAGFS